MDLHNLKLYLKRYFLSFLLHFSNFLFYYFFSFLKPLPWSVKELFFLRFLLLFIIISFHTMKSLSHFERIIVFLRVMFFINFTFRFIRISFSLLFSFSFSFSFKLFSFYLLFIKVYSIRWQHAHGCIFG